VGHLKDPELFLRNVADGNINISSIVTIHANFLRSFSLKRNALNTVGLWLAKKGTNIHNHEDFFNYFNKDMKGNNKTYHYHDGRCKKSQTLMKKVRSLPAKNDTIIILSASSSKHVRLGRG